MLNNVLIADSNRIIVEMVAGLIISQTKLLKVFKAHDYDQVCNILNNESIRLVITSLREPEYGGVALISRICGTFPEIRTIVLVSEGKPNARAKLNPFPSNAIFFDQYQDMNMLFQRILSELNINYGGRILNANLPAFLQMLALEQQNSTLYISSKHGTGILRMYEGELVAARTGYLVGTDAALEILRWTNVSIEINYGTLEIEPQITSSLFSLIIDSTRISDEENHQRAANKRHHDRHDLVVTIDYESNGTNRQCVLHDLSLGGAYLETEQTLQEGRQIVVTLSSPTLKTQCTVDALVVRAGSRGIGVQFQLASIGQRKVIQSMINASIIREKEETHSLRGTS